MSLPQVPTRRGEVEIAGEKVAIRSLTRAEAMRVKGCENDLDRAEKLLIQFGTDTPADEVTSWYESVEAGVVDELVTAIAELSGFGTGAQFRG